MALVQPEMSWRRNRSAKTVINSQNHTTKDEYRKGVHQKIATGPVSVGGEP
jgi:hypothetical protein